MSSYAFDRDTALDQVGPPDSAGVSEVLATLSPDWWIGPQTLNGGYVQAVVVNAVRTAVPGHADVVAVSSTYVSPASPGPVAIEVRALRSGRSVTTATGTARQGDRVLVHCLVTLGEVPVDPPPAPLLPMPVVPPPEQCVALVAEDGTRPDDAPGLASMLDTRFPPERAGWLRGRLESTPRIQAWLRLHDGRPLDSLSLLGLSDMLPPVAFSIGRFGWAPTLQLQVGVFAQPTGEWLLGDLVGSPYDGAFVCEDGDFWDSTGRLVMRARQVAMPPRSRG